MKRGSNKDRKVISKLFFIIFPLVLGYAILLIINDRFILTQFYPSIRRDRHFLDRVAKNLVFSENPLEFSTKYYGDYFLLISNTQTYCQYYGNKCDVTINIRLNSKNLNNRDNSYFEFTIAIKDPQNNNYYETSGEGFLVDRLDFTNETKDELVFYGGIYGSIQYRSEDITKEIRFSPKIKFIIPINDSKKDEFIKLFKN